jgi:uncharacterized membrane protein
MPVRSAFETQPAGRGTTVTVSLEYNPPPECSAPLSPNCSVRSPGTQVQDDLRRFKQLMEAGEIPTIAGQPHGVLGHSKAEN